MPGLIRRLVIFAAADGLILQAHGHPEHHRVLHIDYRSQAVTERARSTLAHSQDHDSPRLEAHGLIGLINIANEQFLIAITRRKEVARIFDKPVFLITDVAVLPISSQSQAREAIQAITDTAAASTDIDDSSGSDSGDSDTEQASQTELAATPGGDIRPFASKNSSSTSVAENVARGTASFGRFATQWFSRQRTSSLKSASAPGKNSDTEPKPASKEDQIVEDVARAEELKEHPPREGLSQRPGTAAASATRSLQPRILRTIKMILTSGSYFYSYDIDLTRRLEQARFDIKQIDAHDLDAMYFWNKSLGARLLESDGSNFLTPVLQGFVGQRTFRLSKGRTTDDKAEVAALAEESSQDLPVPSSDREQQDFVLTLISRRSTKRSGLRYLRRGIDDEGNVANFTETEQMLSSATWDASVPIRSFTQVRGSIPLYFSQSPYSFKPAVVFHNSPQANEKAYEKHFQALDQRYGAIYIAALIDKHATEKPIGEAYQRMFEKFDASRKTGDVSFEWFDFHAECRGMKFENVSRLISKLEPFLISSGETVLSHGKVISRQQGVVRTNCMDCLDRTNVAQSAFAQHSLQRDLEQEGYSIDFVTDPNTNWFNTLWADNGDAISRQYAGTAALKGDFTRTRKRNWKGAMNDFGLTISRYYSNMVNDYFSQAVIDVLLGNVSWKIFEDFESTMMSADPGISVQSGREMAIETCSKIAIPDPEKEDLIHAWTMLVPNQENTLRTLPFEEAVVLLTDAAIYCCKMDWTTEKVARYEKVDLRNVKNIRCGIYVTSTFTERQMQEDINQGLVITYSPGKDDMVRVNTRSLQNVQAPGSEERQGVDGGTGILSWVASSVSQKTAAPDRVMALKVHLPNEDDVLESAKGGSPRQVAEHIAYEIKRAIVGSGQEAEGPQLITLGNIISAADAKKRTGYLEQVSHSLKRFVWA